MPRSAIFISGTDTGVGKTSVTCALLHAIKPSTPVSGFKPIASGLMLQDGSMINEDTLAIQRITGEPSDWITPFAFEPPIAPHIAAEQAGNHLTVSKLDDAMEARLARQKGLSIIEGCGGWLVPLNHRETMADWVVMRKLPVLMVVSLKLGCLNHALLTEQSIEQSGLSCIGWVGVCIEPQRVREENIHTLTQMLSAPCLGIMPHQGQQEHLHDWLNLSMLKQNIDQGSPTT